jgi:recombination protein RecA
MRRASEKPPWKHIPTGIFTLDMAMHGGIPRSQMTLIFGRESSGKSTLALKVLGNAQEMFPDQEAILIDIEGTYDETWAARHKVDNDKLWLVQPSTGENALDIADEIIRLPNISVVVVDSLAALIPYKEIEASTENDLPGLQARLIGKFVRKIISGLVDQRKEGHIPTIILLNQWRYKIGVFMGDPRVLPGGQAQHYAAFAKIEILNKETVGKDVLEQDTVDFNTHTFKIIKNKEGTAIRHGEFKMIRNPANELGQGFIADADTVATWARKFGVITGSGAGGFRIDGVDQKFRVLKDIEAYMYENPLFYESFKMKLISMYRIQNGLREGEWL